MFGIVIKKVGPGGLANEINYFDTSLMPCVRMAQPPRPPRAVVSCLCASAAMSLQVRCGRV